MFNTPSWVDRRTAAAQAPTLPPLIETKLGPPRARPGLVARARLLDQLDRFAPAALTLVDAPVGFGKTMLVESWLARTGGAVAWVSLEAADNDPARLWTYVATSVDRIRPGLGTRRRSRCCARPARRRRASSTSS